MTKSACLHGPEREDALFVEKDARLLLVLLPLDHVQEGGRPLVGNLVLMHIVRGSRIRISVRKGKASFENMDIARSVPLSPNGHFCSAIFGVT